MKKYLLPILYCASASYGLAQGQFSIKIAPILSYSRVYTNPDTAGFSSDGSALRFKLGPLYDWNIKGDYYLSTGLLWAAQQASIKNDSLSIQEQHELQYLQVPLLLKLYTGEIRLDTRLYFELGAIGTLKINDRVTKLTQPKPLIKTFQVLGLGGLFGLGIEYNITLFTSISGGISYQLGMTSMFREQQDIASVPKVLGYADFVSLDIGIKF